MKKIVAIVIAFVQMLLLSNSAFADTSFFNNGGIESNANNVLSDGISYLYDYQNQHNYWVEDSKNSNTQIAYILNCFYLHGLEYESIPIMVDNFNTTLFNCELNNNDDFFNFLLINHNDVFNRLVIDLQNPDGGFGLAENYASDIIDTKLALKALADLGEMEAMTNAAMYIASLQNDDGGFSFQPGLDSNPELTAEIADIFGDCIIKDQSLAYTLSETLIDLNDYLDDNMPAIEDLETNDMPEVYQHFHTALFKLKTTGSYNVTPYYDLQAEDGGVFDDPMATALFLELIVREQNSLIASIDHITVTNDRGYSVSAFNANENVNINVVSDYETAKAYLKVSIETPSGSTIQLTNPNLVWNTCNSEEGTYKVKAEIVRSSNQETVVSLTQEFRVLHRLSIDNLSLSLSQSYSRVGDTDSVSINADVSLQNFSEDTDDVDIRWSIISNNEVIDSDSIEVTEADLAAETIHLTDCNCVIKV